MHALKSGMDVKAYAEKVGRARNTVGTEVRAARVAVTVPDIGHGTSHHILNEIHAAPFFLWPALVAAAAAEEWRKLAAKVSNDLPPSGGAHHTA